jgi:hypothetical protein
MPRDRTFVGHRLTPAARRSLDEYEAQKEKLTEEELIRGYGASLRMPPRRLERPETPVYDESGLVHGEPVSEGRTVRQEGDQG